MRVYISGPLTLGGRADAETVARYRGAFDVAAAAVVAAGKEPLSPTTLRADDGRGESWEAWVRRALVMMLDADECWLLPDWHLSPGARIEASVASWLMPVREWRLP